MMEYNRNLSSVIDSIQDEGPSSSIKEGATEESAAVDDTPRDEPLAAAGSTGRSVVRILFFGLIAGLVIAGGLLFFVGASDGYFPGISYDFSKNSAVDQQAVDIQLQEIRERQAQIGNRVEQLAAAVAETNATLREWQSDQAAREDVQADRRGSISGIETLAPDQHGLPTPLNNEVDETSITEPAALPVPNNEMGAAAVTEPGSGSPPQVEASAIPIPRADETIVTGPDSTRIPAVQTGATAVTEPGPTAEPHADVNAPVTVPATRQGSGEQEWVINIAYFAKQEPIQKLMARLGQAGITTEQQQININGKTGYRLRIPGFSTSKEASEYAKKNLGDDLGLEAPWVSRR